MKQSYAQIISAQSYITIVIINSILFNLGSWALKKLDLDIQLKM